jgi:hypothetical protein
MKRQVSLCAVVLSAWASSLAAQEPAAPKPSGPAVPLRVQVTFSRFQGETRTSRSPFALALVSGDPAVAVAAGLQNPVTVKVQDAPTIMYKDAATKLECAAEALDGGRFRLSLDAEQTAVAQAQSPGAPAPVLRLFRSSGRLVLRNGETAQLVAAWDPVSGERIEVDVTLSVRD